MVIARALTCGLVTAFCIVAQMDVTAVAGPAPASSAGAGVGSCQLFPFVRARSNSHMFSVQRVLTSREPFSLVREQLVRGLMLLYTL